MCPSFGGAIQIASMIILVHLSTIALYFVGPFIATANNACLLSVLTPFSTVFKVLFLIAVA